MPCAAKRRSSSRRPGDHCSRTASPSRARPRASRTSRRGLDPHGDGHQVAPGAVARADTLEHQQRAPGPRGAPRGTPRRSSRSAGSARARLRRADAGCRARGGRPRRARSSRGTGRPCGPRAPRRGWRAAVGQGGLAGAGRPVDADQAARAEAGWPGTRPSVEDVGPPCVTRRSRGRGTTSTESMTVSPATRWTRLVCSASSPDFACRNQTQSPIASPGRAGAGEGGLHLAGALEAGQVQARTEPTGVGARSLPGGPLATKPPPATVARSRRPGRRTTGQAEERGRTRLEALVVVEERGHQQPGPGGDLGDGRVCGGRLDAARAAARSRTPGRPARAGPARSCRAASASWAIEADLSRRTTIDLARWPGTSSGTPATWPS